MKNDVLKIQIFSDTHSDLSRVRINPDVDIIANAGDFTKREDGFNQIMKFVELCDMHGKPHVINLGNHDYYGSVYREDLLEKLKSNKVNVLYKDNPFVFNGWNFIGDTLFSGFNLRNYDHELSKKLAQIYVNDFNLIKMKNGDFFTAEACLSEFNEQWAYIQKYRGQKNTVVMTHFPPCIECIHPAFTNHPLNPYFINDLDLSGFSHWICGHTHATSRLMSNGCKVFINASGYTGAGERECLDFESNFIIEVERSF